MSMELLAPMVFIAVIAALWILFEYGGIIIKAIISLVTIAIMVVILAAIASAITGL